VIHLDTSVLVDALSGRRRSATQLQAVTTRGERMGISALVLYEWLRGPRTPAELTDQEALFPTGDAAPFGAPEALLAARLHREVSRSRHRELDLGIAACAIAQGARLWTLNADDFADVPGLHLYQPPS